MQTTVSARWQSQDSQDILGPRIWCPDIAGPAERLQHQGFKGSSPEDKICSCKMVQNSHDRGSSPAPVHLGCSVTI